MADLPLTVTGRADSRKCATKPDPACILIVDSVAASRRRLSKLLHREGYQVLEATTATEALEKSLEGVDLVCLSVGLPDLDGFEICRQLKADQRTAMIPVMHLSDRFVDDEARAEGLNAGADAYLAEPADSCVLLATMRSLLRVGAAEKGLKATATHWQTTFDAISDAIFLTDSQGIVVRCNRAAERLARRPFGEIVGKLYERVIRECLGDSSAIFFEPIEGEGHESREMRIGRHWFRVTADQLPQNHGVPGGTVFILSDVTLRVKAQEELLESQQELSSVLESIVDGYIAFDQEWRIVDVNARCEEYMGRQRFELVGQVVWEVLPNLVGSEYYRQYHRAADLQQPVHFEVCHPTGARWFEVHAYPSPYGLRVHMRDISDRKRLELELRERTRELAASEAFYRIVGETIEYGVWRTDAEGRFTYVSPSFAELLGTTPREMTELGWMHYLLPEEAETTLAKWKKTIAAAAEWDQELQFVAKDGTVHTILSRGKPIHDQRGTFVGYGGINLEITGIKQVEEQLRYKVEELEAFTRSVSHDLRGPLTNIGLFAEILQREVGDSLSPAALRQIQSIVSGVEKMRTMIERLLQFSRAGREDLKQQPLELDRLVNEVLDEFAPEIQKRKVTVTVEPLPLVLGDELLIKHVFSNLISNSLKFTRSNSHPAIHIGQQTSSGEHVLIVRDNGVGFPGHHAARLFRVFERLHDQEDYEGSGIGLSIVSRIVARHSGRVWAESRVGEGATFYFTLPVIPDR